MDAGAATGAGVGAGAGDTTVLTGLELVVGTELEVVLEIGADPMFK